MIAESYFEYVESRAKYDAWNEKTSDLRKREKKIRTSLASANKLKDKVSEAETIAISNIIDSINLYAQSFLEVFFEDDPITVTLQPFKEVKKGTSKAELKPQINVAIHYKDHDCDLNSLSGGELQRVTVAFNLALAEMFSTPIVLLDECTSSLDQNLTNNIVTGIRENFKDKAVLLIAHQVVTGLFDDVVNV